MTTIDTTAMRERTQRLLDKSATASGGAVLAALGELGGYTLRLCDEVDRLTRELNDAIARDCPLGEDCDLTVAYMAGERRAENRLRAALAQAKDRPFGEAFADARSRGLKTFWWGDGEYHTRTADER